MGRRFLLLAILGCGLAVAAVDASVHTELKRLVSLGATPDQASAAFYATRREVLTVPEAVGLFQEGVPVVYLAVLLDPDGDGLPRVSESGGSLELCYDSFRILASPSADGPRVVVTGYDAEGDRLAPPVEPAPQAPIYEARSAPARREPPISIDLKVEPPQVVVVQAEPQPRSGAVFEFTSYTPYYYAAPYAAHPDGRIRPAKSRGAATPISRSTIVSTC